MITKQSLALILAAADKTDDEDVEIRVALYIALRGMEKDFAAFSGNPREDRSFPNPTPVASSPYEIAPSAEQHRQTP